MEYRVVYSKRKSISIHIEKCDIVVKAPLNTEIKVIEDLLLKHREWIVKHIELAKKKSALFEGITEDDIIRLKREARIYFKDKTEHFSRIMGLKYGRITITSAQKRFGSCSSQGNISYSYRLMLYPEAAREYVVVHELAHLKQMNHSKRFYDIIASVLPDYKNRKRLLK